MALVAPRYAGLELPIYDESVTPWASTQELYNQKFSEETSTDSTVVRLAQLSLSEVRSSPLTDRTLPEILRITDTELERVAELCEALVVEHEWGLYPAEAFCPNTRVSNQPWPLELVPKGYMLVAKVAVIHDTETFPDDVSDEEIFPSDVRRAIKDGLKEYTRDAGVYHLNDMRLDQFTMGRPVEALQYNRDAWLVDIEPRLGIRIEKQSPSFFNILNSCFLFIEQNTNIECRVRHGEYTVLRQSSTQNVVVVEE